MVRAENEDGPGWSASEHQELGVLAFENLALVMETLKETLEG